MDYNPIHIILQIKKIEYRYLLLPFALIIGTFIAVKFYHITQLKLLSLFALFLYIFIKILFRITKIIHTEIDESIKSIKSPISGKVTFIENNVITISKSLFDKADLRKINSDYRMIRGKVSLIKKSDIQSVLEGIVPGIAECKVLIKANYQINVKIGQKVTSGLTDLGIHNE